MSNFIKTIKHLLSFVAEVPEESTKSQYSRDIKVSLYKGQHLLTSENAIYSFGKLYYAFSEVFKKIDLSHKKIRNVLVLGFGIGSIPEILTDYGRFKVTGIELDPEIVRLAWKYMHPPAKENLDIICMDAEDYVRETSEQFDLITMDIFIDAKVPDQFESVAFLQNLKKLLTDKGILLYNRLYFNESLKLETEDFYSRKFLTVFPEAHALKIKGNLILIYDRQSLHQL